jgi:hypothetical protein
MASGEDFEGVVGAWLEELIAQVQPIQSFPLRLRRGQILKGDSGNYHNIDFVIEAAVSPPDNLGELLKACEESSKEVEKKRAIYGEGEQLLKQMEFWKAVEEFLNAVDQLINSFKYDARILIEVKGIGWSGEKPTEQTYREHMLRAYACLGDSRNQTDKQKYVIVPYKLVKQRSFDYDCYFRSIDTFLLDYSNSREKSILEDKIRRLEEEILSKLKYLK